MKKLIAPFIITAFLILLSRTSQAAIQLDEPSFSNTYLPVASKQVPPEWIGPGGGAILDLAEDANNPDTVYAGTWGGGVYKSTDSGKNWQPVNSGLGNLFLDSLAVAPSNSNIVYAGTYRGKVYKSTDAGFSWKEAFAGIQDQAIVYSLAIDPDNARRVFAGTRGISNDGYPPWNGVVYRTENGGGSWKPVLTNVGGSSQEDWAYSIAINPNKNDQIFAATHEHGVYRSDNNGADWAAVNYGISDLTGRAILVDPRKSQSGTVYLGVFHKTGLFKTLNSGSFWTLKNTGLDDVRIYQMTIDPTRPDTLYLASFDDGILKSTNTGESWITIGLAGEIIGDVAINPGENKIILSGTLENGLFRSTDGGNTWVHAQRGLNASTVTSLVINPNNSDELIASLNPGWVTRSTNGGRTWKDFRTDLPDKIVHQIVMKPDNPNILFALTDKSGLYRCNLEGVCWKKMGEYLALSLSSSTYGESTYPENHPKTLTGTLEALFPGQEGTLLKAESTQASTPLLTMVFAPSNTNIAYLGTSGEGLFRSNDSGLNWSSAGLAGRSVWSVAVDPNNPDLLYAAVDAPGMVKISKNGGKDWTNSNLPVSKASVFDIALSETITNTLYAATSKGVYKLTGGGWSGLGLSDTEITTIVSHPTIPGVLIAGTDDGIMVSQDDGKIWAARQTELEGIAVMDINFHPYNPSQIYVCTQYHGIFLTHY